MSRQEKGVITLLIADLLLNDEVNFLLFIRQGDGKMQKKFEMKKNERFPSPQADCVAIRIFMW